MRRLRILFFLFFVGFGGCIKTGELTRQKSYQLAKIKELQLKYDNLYGGATEPPKKLWEFELEDWLSYPRGDKYKLHEISKQWIKYYECCAHSLRKLTATGSLAAISITAYEGSIARIPCGICTSRLHPPVTWLYAKSLNNLTYAPMEEKETAVFANGLLTIYQVRREDAGIYMCQLGATYGNAVMLEVIDYYSEEENPSVVVKPRYSHGQYTNPPMQYNGIKVFNTWAPWSGCSRCGRWGRRRRYGMCHVKLDSKIDKSSQNEYDIVCEEGRKILTAFPGGVGCRSKFLPRCLRNIPAVRIRPNVIMLEMCKTPCKTDVVYKVLTQNGVVLESANNSAGIYSLTLPLPRQPPPVTREVLFAMIGQPTRIQCKGISLRDMPVTWRKGTYRISERGLDKQSNGRVRVNAYDNIVFATVWDQDAGVYSCWQNDILVGVVKLEVWTLEAAITATRVLLFLCILLAVYTHSVIRGRRRNRLVYKEKK